MSITGSQIILSPAMRDMVDGGMVNEDKVRAKTAEAFELLLHPLLLHYEGKDTKKMKSLLKSGLVDVNGLCQLPNPKSAVDLAYYEPGLLHLAAIKLKPYMIHLLCENGADPNLENGAGDPPLHNVCYDDLEREYPFNKRTTRTDANALKKIATALIDCGANPDKINPLSHASALGEAIQTQAFYLCQLYMDVGVNFMKVPHPDAGRGSFYNLLITRRNQIRASAMHYDVIEDQQSEDMNACIDRFGTIHGASHKWVHDTADALPTKNDALQAANIGILNLLFTRERWDGKEQQAIDLICTLPPFIQQQLEPQLAQFSTTLLRDETEKDLASTTWCSRLAEEKKSERTR